jgi:hypothetical protein
MSCAICLAREAETPYVTDCGHAFCYYCLKTACLQDEQFSCPRWVKGGCCSAFELAMSRAIFRSEKGGLRAMFHSYGRGCCASRCGAFFASSRRWAYSR